LESAVSAKITDMTEVMENGENGHHNGHRKETEEERRIRKEKERRARENETEEERRIRKEKERREGKDKERRKETEEERRIRKEKEKREGKEKRKETEEERAARKEKERREKKNETEEERKARKERERKEGHDKRRETSEERRIRKEKERSEGKEKRKETEEERRIRKEKEKRDGKERRKETEEERAARKEKERKERDKRSEVKTEMMELGDEYFAAEEERLSKRERKIKEEEEAESYENGDGDYGEVKEEDDEDTKEGIIKEEIPMDDDGSDDETPLAKRKKPSKRKAAEWDSDDEPLSQKKAKKKKKQHSDYEDEEDDYDKPKKKPKTKTKPKQEAASPTKKMTKKEKELEEEKKVWKWWEEGEQLPDGVKWRFLEHKGPMLAPDYEPLPKHVRFWYDGKAMKLSEETEECATFYGRMLDHDYTTKEVFNKNFFKDWRKTMTAEEKERIRDLSKCDFSEINEHFKKVSEERKNRSKEEKKAEKEKNDAIVEEYGFCLMDGHKEKIGNFRIEPPGLFRGRGEHPKQGMIKRRTMPEDVIINCSKDSEQPMPPKGHKWKQVKHDNTVTWLASWTENVQGQVKYVMLNPSSRLKGEKDWQKYEKARKLKGEIDKIREEYMADLKSKEMRIRQRAVALYFIDKLALRAGNEKDEDQADTVGCCSLRVEHIELHDQKGEDEFVVEFDFLGKDSIRYHNLVPVEKRVFKNLKLFKENKKEEDDLFDRLNTSILNQYLQQLMEGLTAKVFRTYNASFTLQQQLDELTDPSDNVAAKMLSYNRANREVAILCNHQRAVPKTFDKSMENLAAKIEAKQDAIKEAEKKFKSAKKAYKNGGSQTEKANLEKAKKAIERLMEQLEKLEIQRTDKDENKTIALGTSKLNYLDPRISVAWCKKHEVPIEKVYNKTQREKFRWAIDMIMNEDEEYVF